MKVEILKKHFKHCHYIIGSLSFIIFLTAGLFFAGNGKCQETVSKLKDNTFHMTVHRPKNSPLYKWVDLMYSEIFGHLNIKLKLVNQPIKRSSYDTNRGKMDGEPGRIYAYGASYPNLIRIEEPVYFMVMAACTADPLILNLNGWESLGNTDYRVEYRLGVKICEINLTKMVKPEQLSTIGNTLSGLRRLAVDRIDIFVDDMDAIIPILQNNDYDLKSKIRIIGIMKEVPMYMYVNKKHKALVPKLTDAIKTVKSKGLIEKYHKIAFGIIDD